MEKYDKSLVEVWEWKESVYQDVKKLSDSDYAEKLKRESDEILSAAGVKLRTVSKHRALLAK